MSTPQPEPFEMYVLKNLTPGHSKNLFEPVIKEGRHKTAPTNSGFAHTTDCNTNDTELTHHGKGLFQCPTCRRWATSTVEQTNN